MTTRNSMLGTKEEARVTMHVGKTAFFVCGHMFFSSTWSSQISKRKRKARSRRQRIRTDKFERKTKHGSNGNVLILGMSRKESRTNTSRYNSTVDINSECSAPSAKKRQNANIPISPILDLEENVQESARNPSESAKTIR